MARRQPRDIGAAARQVRAAMEDIYAGLGRLAEASGYLFAMADNADTTETLTSVRSDTGYQLIKDLGGAYDQLAGYLASAFQQGTMPR